MKVAAATLLLCGVAATSSLGVTLHSTHRAVEHDLRKCAAPLCGGYWVSLVNWTTWQTGLRMTLAEIARRPHDYTTRLLKGVHRAEVGRGVLGQFTLETDHDQASTTGTGSFVGVRDNGVRCITFPCPSLIGAVHPEQQGVEQPFRHLASTRRSTPLLWSGHARRSTPRRLLLLLGRTRQSPALLARGQLSS